MGLNHAVNQELLKTNYHYKKLYDQHQSLKQKIDKEASHPATDVSKVKALKCQKLRLADQMTSIENAFL